MIVLVLEPDVVAFACDQQQVEKTSKHHHWPEHKQLPEGGKHEAGKHGRRKTEVPWCWKQAGNTDPANERDTEISWCHGHCWLINKEKLMSLHDSFHALKKWWSQHIHFIAIIKIRSIFSFKFTLYSQKFVDTWKTHPHYKLFEVFDCCKLLVS